MYGKLINGDLVLAPRKVKYNRYWIYNPPADVLLALGYKPVQYTDPPDPVEGFHPEFYWTETEDEILQVWQMVPDEEVPEE